MTPELLERIDRARRLAGQYVEPWRARAGSVMTTDGAQVVTLGRFHNVDTAIFIVELQALFLPLVNELIETRKRLLDWRG